MRGLLKLVGKEWRDVRAVTGASAVLVVAACLGVRWYLEERYGLSMADFPSTPRHFDVFVPACAALYATLIAADAVGGEVASRRIDLVELLPAGRGRVWAAKAVFLLAASLVFTVWCALVQWGVLLAIDGAPFAEPFVTRAIGSPWVLGLVATFAGTTLLVSTTGLRGLAAALVGATGAVGLFAAAHTFLSLLGYPAIVHTVERYEPSYRESIAALWLPPAVLAAAGLAYRFGRVHLGKVARPAWIALGVLAVAVAAPGAALAHHALSVVPGRAGTTLQRLWPSPDGRHIALHFVNERSPSQASKVFVLDTERSALVEPEVSRGYVEMWFDSWNRAWAEDGSLVLCTPRTEGIDRAWIDPSTGAVRRRETQDHRAFGEESRGHSEKWRESYRWRLSTHRRCDDGGPTYEATAADSKSEDRPKFRTWAPAGVPWRIGRIVYFPEPCVLAVRALPDGDERRLLTNREPWRGFAWQVGGVSADGRLLLVEHDGAWKALDLETGATTELPPCGTKPHWWGVLGDDSRRIVVTRSGNDATEALLVDLATGARLTLPTGDADHAFASSDGNLVVLRGDQALDLVDRNLKVVRRLWPVGKE